jgi:hypothetical protein
MMKLKFKSDVFLLMMNLNPSVTWILQCAMHTAPLMIDDTLVVTSAADGTHSTNSRHYPGLAFDIRYMGDREGGVDISRIMPPGLIPLGDVDFAHAQRDETIRWSKRLAQVLGSDYDVVVEKTHMHIEWDA